METDDPLVMYLVVRRRTARPFAELARAAALATRRCTHRFRDDERWRVGFEDWWRHSFRKVCLRAEPREWEAIRSLDHERVGDVACLPPVRRSARDRVLARMQALGDQAGPLPGVDEPPCPGLTLVVAASLGMSAGKTLAQIGHAALMADPDPGLDVHVAGAGPDDWARLLGSAEAVVRDGGLTELEPGSETVLVLERLHPVPARAAPAEDEAMARILIVNPFASGVTERKLDAVQAALPPGTQTILTRGPADAIELAAEWSPRVEAIYVFSGDGTYNEVINGLRADVPVGFVPGGGTSVLPRALGLPRDPVHAAERLAFGKPRRISLGRINGRLFAFNAGIGLDAELVRRVDALGRRADGRRPGDVAFAKAVLKALAERGFSYEPSLEIEGLGRAAFALVANCSPYTYVGRLGLRFAPDATFEGGLDVVAPVDVRPWGIPRLASQALRGRPRPGSTLLGHDLDRIVIRCDAPLPAQVDGEDIGDVERVELVAVRDALTVLT